MAVRGASRGSADPSRAGVTRAGAVDGNGHGGKFPTIADWKLVSQVRRCDLNHLLSLRIARSGLILSETHLPAADALKQLPLECGEGATLSIMEIDRIARGPRVIAVTHKLALLVLERGGHLDLPAQPQEQRTRVGRQLLDEVLAQGGEIDGAIADDGRHAGAPVASGNRHPVYGRLNDAGKPR